MSHARLLIVHPDPSALGLLRSMLYALGNRIEEAASDREAVRLLERAGADLVLVGVDPSDPDALELLNYARRKHPETRVVLLFTSPNPERSREAHNRGAASVLRYPLPATELRAAVSQALDHLPPPPAVPAANGAGGRRPAASEDRNRGEGQAAGHPGEAEPMLGQDPYLRLAVELAAAIAPTRTSVLISGERGTGKSLLARNIHRRSARGQGPFIELTCGDRRESYLERELFGPGADEPADGPIPRPGKLEQAHGGTLFLSDVAGLGIGLQRALLRVLQDIEAEPGRSPQAPRPDFRLIASTSEDLAALVAQGRFSQDLFDRIGGVCLKLPPLRQRGADIEALAQHFRARYAHDLGKEVLEFTTEAIGLLKDHPWPGNVGELQSTVERGVVLCRGPRITPANLALFPEGPPRPARPRLHTPRPHLAPGIRPLKEALEEPEKQLILEALHALNWNRQETARILDINRTTLYKKMKKYGLLDREPAWIH